MRVMDLSGNSPCVWFWKGEKGNLFGWSLKSFFSSSSSLLSFSFSFTFRLYRPLGETITIALDMPRPTAFVKKKKMPTIHSCFFGIKCQDMWTMMLVILDLDEDGL